MVAKKGQEIKRKRNCEKRAKIDLATNRYMINLAWGIFVIILLRFVEAGYSSADTVLTMPTLMKMLACVFAVGSVALFVCGKINLANRKGMFWGYSTFTLVLALGSLWIGFFNNIRNFFVELNPVLGDIDSRWWISRGWIVVVAVYLVITLVWTTVKISMIEKGKKF